MTTNRSSWGIAVYPRGHIRPVVRMVPNRAIAEMMAAEIRKLSLLAVEVIFCGTIQNP